MEETASGELGNGPQEGPEQRHRSKRPFLWKEVAPQDATGPEEWCLPLPTKATVLKCCVRPCAGDPRVLNCIPQDMMVLCVFSPSFPQECPMEFQSYVCVLSQEMGGSSTWGPVVFYEARH